MLLQCYVQIHFCSRPVPHGKENLRTYIFSKLLVLFYRNELPVCQNTTATKTELQIIFIIEYEQLQSSSSQSHLLTREISLYIFVS